MHRVERQTSQRSAQRKKKSYARRNLIINYILYTYTLRERVCAK